MAGSLRRLCRDKARGSLALTHDQLGHKEPLDDFPPRRVTFANRCGNAPPNRFKEVAWPAAKGLPGIRLLCGSKRGRLGYYHR
jgi:hypothetical protein